MQEGLKALQKITGKTGIVDYAYAMLTLHDDKIQHVAEMMLKSLEKRGVALQISRERLLQIFVGKEVNLNNFPPIQSNKCCYPECGVNIIYESRQMYFCSSKCAIQTEYEIFRKALQHG